MGSGSGIQNPGSKNNLSRIRIQGFLKRHRIQPPATKNNFRILNFCKGIGKVLPETNSCSETWLSSDLPLLSDLLGLYSEMIHSTPCFSYQAISVFRMEGRQCSATDPNADNN